MPSTLPVDPYNLVITGVGGQGNVLASRMLGNVLNAQGLAVTIGETFGASQRGGSVMSHLRVSAEGSWSPQIPAGQAHMVLALEPLEALRVLAVYGNPGTKVIVNQRPVMTWAALSGQAEYPDRAAMEGHLAAMTARHWWLAATEEALTLGAPILANIILMGGLAAVGDLPITREGFAQELTRALGPKKVPANLEAFDRGYGLVAGAGGGPAA